MLPLRSLIESESDNDARPLVIGVPPERLKAANSNLRPPANFWEDQEREFASLSKQFLDSFRDKELGSRILADIPEVLQAPQVLRYYVGVNLLLEKTVSQLRNRRFPSKNLDDEFQNAEGVILYFVQSGFIPSKPHMEEFFSEVFPTLKGLDANATIFNTYENLQTALPRRSELELRELLIRFQRWYGIGGDAALLPIEKFDGGLANKVLEFFKILYGAYLRRDFDEALDEHSRRQRRFAPKKSGGVYKQVKLQLHEDLIPVLTEALAGGNRNAFIEEAIVEKLQREGVEFDLPDQPPLPGG